MLGGTTSNDGCSGSRLVYVGSRQAEAGMEVQLPGMLGLGVHESSQQSPSVVEVHQVTRRAEGEGCC